MPITANEHDDLRKKMADLEVTVMELEAKLLKDIATMHRSLKDYKQENNSTLAEVRAVVESLLRGRRG